MARSKYTERFCSYCNKQTKMEIMGEMEGVVDKIWFKCTRCRHKSLLTVSSGTERSAPLDAKNATPYDPQSKYNVGQAIFHGEWNDVGKVMSKITTSNGDHAMVVAFEKLGERRLVENLKSEFSAEAASPHGEQPISG